MKKILVITNSIDGLYSFRRELIEELIKNNCKTIIVSPKEDRSIYFTDIGCDVVKIPINRRGTNLIEDFKLFYQYFNIIKNLKPNIVLTYTIKPNVYGGIACRLLGIPYISNITGLGKSFENKGLIRIIALRLYKIALKKAVAVFFQNANNRNLFVGNQIAKKNISKLIPGSGVNLNQHNFEEYPAEDGHIRLLFIGRAMKEKGIDELLKAAQIIKESYSQAEFQFVGRIEEGYETKIKELEKSGIIKHFGLQNKENVHMFIKNSHATINPSYHEGMSNVLLESASTGRPLLASKIPGCLEAFDEGISGMGFEVKDSNSLVEVIIKFLELPYEHKKTMGLAGREKMEKEFDRNIVINAYMKEICEIINKREEN